MCAIFVTMMSISANTTPTLLFIIHHITFYEHYYSYDSISHDMNITINMNSYLLLRTLLFI